MRPSCLSRPRRRRHELKSHRRESPGPASRAPWAPLAAVVALAASLAAVACGGGGSSATPTATRLSTAPSARPSTPVALASPAATKEGQAVDEVTGIVGVVINNSSTRAISIQRLSGAPVTKIDVDTGTKIKRATGGSLTLSEVRSSDRIIARGTLNERRDALVATEITVQDVVPGSAPGG